MEVALIDIKMPGDNKDFNGGFGTTFEIGRSFRTKLLKFARRKLENVPTLSYAYVSAIFKSYGHHVNYYENKEPEKDYNIALLHVSLIRHEQELKMIKRLKEKKKKNSKIGVYGPLATVMPELFNEADFVIVGEPEEAIISISKKGKSPINKIVKSNPIDNLDSLPFLDYDIFNLGEFSFSPLIARKPGVFIHGSRGCPYTCSYCPYLIFGKYRYRKPEKIIEELKYLKKKHKIKSFYFRDPTFSVSKERIEKLSRLLIKEKLDLLWGCETRSDLLDEKLLKLMRKAGLVAVKIGVESANHDLLKRHKRITPKIEHQEKIIKVCKKLRIKVVAFYIIGIPTDTKESVLRTIKYSQKLNTSFANFTICTPIPGTSFYKGIENKIFDKNLNHYDNFHSVFHHDNLSTTEIYELQDKAIREYYFRIRYFLRHLADKINDISLK